MYRPVAPKSAVMAPMVPSEYSETLLGIMIRASLAVLVLRSFWWWEGEKRMMRSAFMGQL